MTEPAKPLSLRVADLLEQVAMKIREMSVDRASTAITWIAVGILLIVGTITAVFWLLIGIFRILGTLMGAQETAYAVVGLILIVVGAIVWSKRYPQDKKPQEKS